MPDWKKKILNPGVTTTSTFYGDAVNYIVDYFSGVDLGLDTSVGEAGITTKTIYESGKLGIEDSDGNNELTLLAPSYSEDKTFVFPSITGMSDELMSKSAPQIVTGKTIDFSLNTATAIPKSAIPSTTMYEDENNALGQHYFDLTQMAAAPANPGANVRRVFVNTDGHISAKSSAGTVYDLEAGASGPVGGIAAAGVATFSPNGSLTQFNITHGLTPQPDSVSVEANSVKAMGSFRIAVTSTQIQITMASAPTSGTNDLSFIWMAGYANQAVTGFTPTSTNTLTGKTMDGASNTFTNIAKASIPSAVAYEDEANVFTQAQKVYLNSTTPMTIGKDLNSGTFALNFNQDSSTGVERTMSAIEIAVTDFSNSLEDAELRIRNMEGGTLTTKLEVRSTDIVIDSLLALSTSGLGSLRTVTFPDASFLVAGQNIANTFSGQITLGDGINIALNTTTGTKIGTATSQKLGFYNATPIVQGAAVADIITGTVGTSYTTTVRDVINDLRTKVNSLLARQRAVGLLAP
jgi:hypothetical protein